MKRLFVLGAGGHGRVVADSAESMEVFNEIIFLDDEPGEADVPVMGRCSDLASLARSEDACIVAFGDNRSRLKALKQIGGLGIEIAVVIDASATVGRDCTIGPGSVVLPQAAVNNGSILDLGCIVNTGSTVDHDCRLGECVHVSPGAHLGGDVTAGECTWFGIGSCVRNGVEISRDVVVGAGAVVVSNIPEGITVVGVPARKLD